MVSYKCDIELPDGYSIIHRVLVVSTLYSGQNTHWGVCIGRSWESTTAEPCDATASVPGEADDSGARLAASHLKVHQITRHPIKHPNSPCIRIYNYQLLSQP